MGIEIKEELLDIEGIKRSNKPLLDLFIRRTAVLTSTKESLTEKIIKDQWRHAQRMTRADTDVSEIDFCNLGILFMSPTKAKKKLKKTEEILSKTDYYDTHPDPKVDKFRQKQKRIHEGQAETIKQKLKL